MNRFVQISSSALLLLLAHCCLASAMFDEQQELLDRSKDVLVESMHSVFRHDEYLMPCLTQFTNDRALLEFFQQDQVPNTLPAVLETIIDENFKDDPDYLISLGTGTEREMTEVAIEIVFSHVSDARELPPHPNTWQWPSVPLAVQLVAEQEAEGSASTDDANQEQEQELMWPPHLVWCVFGSIFIVGFVATAIKLFQIGRDPTRLVLKH